MELTRLSVGKAIEFSFGDRTVDKYTEAEVIVMRDGKDLEAKMKERQKFPEGYAMTLSRTPLGIVSVAIEKVEGRTIGANIS